MDNTLIQITDSIYKLVVPISHGSDVNCYFLKGDRGYTVIDTGISSEQAINLWMKVIASRIVIEKIVITHTHSDHIGMAGWLQNRLQIPVVLSRIGYERMQKKYSQWHQIENEGLQEEPYAFFRKHGGPGIPLKRLYDQLNSAYFEPDELFEDGQEIRLGNEQYKAIWTPGHAPDHFCFKGDKNRNLFIGDHVLGGFSPVITIGPDDKENPLLDYFESLDKIGGPEEKLVLPGHGQVIPNLQQRITRIKDGHHFRMREVAQIIKDHELPAGEISRRLYNNADPKKMMAQFQSTLARLIYMESQGQITSRIQEGVVLFSCI